MALLPPLLPPPLLLPQLLLPPLLLPPLLLPPLLLLLLLMLMLLLLMLILIRVAVAAMFVLRQAHVLWVRPLIVLDEHLMRFEECLHAQADRNQAGRTDAAVMVGGGFASLP